MSAVGLNHFDQSSLGDVHPRIQSAQRQKVVDLWKEITIALHRLGLDFKNRTVVLSAFTRTARVKRIPRVLEAKIYKVFALMNSSSPEAVFSPHQAGSFLFEIQRTLLQTQYNHQYSAANGS